MFFSHVFGDYACHSFFGSIVILDKSVDCVQPADPSDI